MILVVAGTRDGRDLAARLAGRGWTILVAVVTGYGRDLAAGDGLAVVAGPRDAAGFAALIAAKGIRALIDASHPYAAAASANAHAACAASRIPYLRYERPPAPLPDYDKLHVAVDATAAARLTAGLGKVVFLTTGSRTLAAFKHEPLLAGHRLIARVLPEPDVIDECRRLGLAPGDIIALQGPFSHQLNLALFREFAAEVIVTKNSGLVGGADSKFSAAQELDLPLVVIDRPAAAYSCVAHDADTVINFVKEAMQ